MSDQSQFAEFLKKAFRALYWLMKKLWTWFTPVVLAIIGYYFFEPLRASVTWPWDTPEVWGPLFFISVPLFIWLVTEFIKATHRNTTVQQLQQDDVVSYLVSLVIACWSVWLLRGDELGWYMVIPCLGAILDGATSGYFSINNAAQKPFGFGTKASI